PKGRRRPALPLLGDFVKRSYLRGDQTISPLARSAYRAHTQEAGDQPRSGAQAGGCRRPLLPFIVVEDFAKFARELFRLTRISAHFGAHESAVVAREDCRLLTEQLSGSQ